jgi:HK97 family phage major capsid protein
MSLHYTQNLRAQRSDKLKAARALMQKPKLTATEEGQFSALVNEIDNINDQLERSGMVRALGADTMNISIGHQPAVYENLGEQLLDVVALATGAATPAKSSAAERYQRVLNAASGGSTGVDSEGGYLVEADKARTIMTSAIETGVLASRCTQQPIGKNADAYVYIAADDRDRSDGKINGIQVYRKGEADTMQDGGKAKLEERELRVEDMYGLIYVTNRMLRDAVSMAEYVRRNLREQLAFKLDREIWEGNGAGQCLGITNSSLPVTVAKEAAQGAGTIVAENVVKMLARFKGDVSQAAWFLNQDCLPQLPLMKVGDVPIFVPGGSFVNAPFGTLFGRPIVPIEFCETVGEKWDIVLGDFSQYLLIRKGGIDAAESMHVKFLTDEMAFRFIARNNGQPIHDTPIVPLKGTNTLSPFVTLEARGE